jgi:hypothetical protein
MGAVMGGLDDEDDGAGLAERERPPEEYLSPYGRSVSRFRQSPLCEARRAAPDAGHES